MKGKRLKYLYSTMRDSALLSPIKRRDMESTPAERFRYYRSRSIYAPKSEPKISSVRELYKQVDAERSLRLDKKPTLASYDPLRTCYSLKQDIDAASRKVEDIISELRNYKNKYEDFIEETKSYQKPKTFITQTQIQDCIAQCQELERQIDLLQAKYGKMLNKSKDYLREGTYEYSKPYIYEKDYLNVTQGSFKTTFESPVRANRIEQLEKEKMYLEKDCNRLRNQISMLEKKAGGDNAECYAKRIEKLEGDVKSLANILEEWSVRTTHLSA